MYFSTFIQVQIQINSCLNQSDWLWFCLFAQKMLLFPECWKIWQSMNWGLFKLPIDALQFEAWVFGSSVYAAAYHQLCAGLGACDWGKQVMGLKCKSKSPGMTMLISQFPQQKRFEWDSDSKFRSHIGRFTQLFQTWKPPASGPPRLLPLWAGSYSPWCSLRTCAGESWINSHVTDDSIDYNYNYEFWLQLWSMNHEYDSRFWFMIRFWIIPFHYGPNFGYYFPTLWLWSWLQNV